ncbi:hypothetical protein HWV62_37139 [Athelia sp. TMB]|nr:hypothetical protein HWV62_37139 [Athelia sp. TMB]
MVFHCVRLFPSGEYFWKAAKDLSRLDANAIQSFLADVPTQPGALHKGYAIAKDPGEDPWPVPVANTVTSRHDTKALDGDGEAEREMPAFDELFTTLEHYNITISCLHAEVTLIPQYSKVGKVMRHIAALSEDQVPRNAEFNFIARAHALVDKWHQLLAAAAMLNASTRSTLNEPIPSELPALAYSLRARKHAIIITWSVILFMAALLPVILFYALWYTSVAHSTTMQIAAAVTGGPSAVQWLTRTWALCKTGSTCRPIGGEWLRLDTYHIEFTLTFIAIAALISASVSRDPPLIPLFAMAPSILLFSVGLQLLTAALLLAFFPALPLPIRLSSLPKGTPLRPATYLIVEDVVAVDGGGGTAFRRAWDARYRASPHMRRLLHRMDAFWGAGALLCAGAVAGVLWGVGGGAERLVDRVYWVGWSMPFVWAGAWAVLTMRYAKTCLREERATCLLHGQRVCSRAQDEGDGAVCVVAVSWRDHFENSPPLSGVLP